MVAGTVRGEKAVLVRREKVEGEEVLHAEEEVGAAVTARRARGERNFMVLMLVLLLVWMAAMGEE